MTVIILVPSFPKLSETFIVSKVLGLLDLGWDVHVVCGRSDPEEWSHFPELQRRPDLRQRVHVTMPHRPRWLVALLFPVCLVRCTIQRPLGTWRYLRMGWRRFGLDILRRFYLDAELIALGPNLVHFEFGSLAAERMYVKELLDCRVIVSFRGYDMNYVGLGTPDYYKTVWEEADALHLLGRDLLNKAWRRGCPSDMPYALIPPAIDPDFFDPHERKHIEVVGTQERPMRILSVGRLEWNKGYEYALQAIRLLIDRNIYCEFHIVGEGDFFEPISFAKHQLGLQDASQLLGAQSRSQVKEEMLWADVFLHSAVSEAFCNAVMEAQAMLLPVVCTDAGGLSENVADEETGFIVPRRDPRPLAERLSLLARKPEIRQQMGQAGRRRVRACFPQGKQVSEFDRLFRQVMPEDKWPGKITGETVLAHGQIETLVTETGPSRKRRDG